MNHSCAQRVLVLHNRYRVEGGEERAVSLQLAALGRAGVPHAALERSSGGVTKGRAAAALMRGGENPAEVTEAVRALGATVVHAHNTLPLIGARGLAAARGAGAKVVLHLHNVRIFCATGFGERDGGPCYRCHGRLTLPGLVLNCRRSLPEAAAYAAALSRHQPALVAAVDRFVAPSAWAAGQVTKLGLPAERVEALAHYLPDEAFSQRSAAEQGAYLLVVSRLSAEKGIDDAIAAAAAAGAPLRIAGEGPEHARLSELAVRSGASVRFEGRVTPERVRELLDGAAALLMPSRYHEFSPYSAHEAIARGVPVAATAMGGLPELLGPGRATAAGDRAAFAARVAALWADPAARRREGGELLERARERHGEERYVRALLDLYGRLGAGDTPGGAA